jgi:hypothetical protein
VLREAPAEGADSQDRVALPGPASPFPEDDEVIEAETAQASGPEAEDEPASDSAKVVELDLFRKK